MSYCCSHLQQFQLMGTKCVEADIKMESSRVPFVPPGFASFSTFSLKRIEDDEIHSHLYQTEKDCRFLNKENFKKTVQDKPWINYGQFSGSEVDLGSENPDHDIPSVSPLKQGVLRGYMGDKTCNQVLTRRHFEDGCRPILDEAPVFYPNEEEFKDTVRYIESIQPKVEPFGICRIVPPPSWKPPCPLKDKVVWENSMFSTHIQWLEKLQNRCPVKQTQCCSTMNGSLDQGEENLDCNKHTMKSCKTGCYIFNERFGFEPGPEFTLKAFEEHANSFKEKYFFSQDKASFSEPSIQDIEGQYWRIIEEQTEEIEVLYGADIDTRVFGSGFPKAHSVDCDIENKYARSGWNLNNTPRLSGSLLSFQGADISGITVPWLYIGMCFSSFCWHVEDHHFYSLSYLHWGAPKIWYGVPGKDALKHEAAMRKHLAALFNEQPDLLHHLVTQFSPATLRTEGVPVYRCIQHPGEFVLTFPRAYHCEFSCGFNCSEAVNLAPIDWLPHGQNAVELYRAQRRKTSISHDMLLFRAAKEAVRAQWNISFLNNPTPDYQLWRDACGQNKILTRVLKARVELEASRRELFCSSKLKKMDPNFDPNIQRECFICHCDLHLSVETCSCSLDTYSCLEHAMQICSCDWRMKSFFHRYEISELNILVDALAGKLSAVHKWGISDLGLSLRSYANKIKLQQDPANQSSTEGNKRKTINCDESCALFTLNEQKSQPLSPQWMVEDAASFKNMFVGEKEATDHQVKDGCSSSGSYSFSNKGLQHSGENRLDDTQDASSYKESNSGKCSISAAKEHRVVILYDAKAGSVENADNEHNSGKCSISAAKENRVVSLYDAKTGSVENADSGQLGGQQKRLKYLQLSDKEETEHKQTFLRVFEWDQPLTVDAKANASRITEKDIEFHPTISVYGHPSSAHLNVMDKGKDDTVRKKLPRENDTHLTVDVAPLTCLHHTRFSMDSDGGSIAKYREKILPYHECENDTHSGNIKISIDTSLVRNTGNVSERKQGKSKSPNVGSLVDDGNIVKSSPVPLYTKKGSAMSKGVRSTICLVEPLKYGVVLSGFFWSNEQAIFPKGYRSRSRYFNILEPNQVCHYISEILDGGHVGPLFMVQLEECPTEVFIHLSASKSWDAVRERLNNEIVRQHSLGNFNVPTLQPPGSVDGFSMFGFSSPKIIQVIESLDEHHVCTNYWRSRPNTPIENSRQVIQEQIDTRSSCVRGSESVLQGIVKKTNTEELQVLHSVLTSDHPSSKLELIQLLDDEIERRVSY